MFQEMQVGTGENPFPSSDNVLYVAEQTLDLPAKKTTLIPNAPYVYDLPQGYNQLIIMYGYSSDFTVWRSTTDSFTSYGQLLVIRQMNLPALSVGWLDIYTTVAQKYDVALIIWKD